VLPTKSGVAKDAVSKYCSIGLQLYLAITTLLNGDFEAGAVLMFSIMAPGIITCTLNINMMSPPFSVPSDKVYKTLYGWGSLARLNYFVDAYWWVKKDEVPNWSIVAFEKYTTATVCVLPSIVTNLLILSRPESWAEAQLVNSLMLAGNCFSLTFTAFSATVLTKVVNGEPGVFDKYRVVFLDETNKNRSRDTALVALIDWTGLSYRLGSLALVAAYTDLMQALVLASGVYFVAMILIKRGILTVMPPAFKTLRRVNVFAMPTMHTCMDFIWLEPNAFQARFLEYLYPVRCVHFGLVLFVILRNIGNEKTPLHEPFMIFLFSYTGICALLWFTVYPFFLFNLHGEAYKEKIELGRKWWASREYPPPQTVVAV